MEQTRWFYLPYILMFIFLLLALSPIGSTIDQEVSDILYGRNVVYSEDTHYQRIDILDDNQFGRMLLLDGDLQLTTNDEHYYHEPLVHIPLTISHNPENILIIGGGDGGALRECLKHSIVTKVTVVELDPRVVEISKQYLKIDNGSFDDPRTNLIFDDGRLFLELLDDQTLFDVIIVDLPDPDSYPLGRLYSMEFYSIVFNRMSESGILITQATSTYFTAESYELIYNTVQSIFGNTTYPIHSWVPTFGDWGFVLAMKNHLSFPSDVDQLLVNRSVSTRMFSEEVFNASFLLPNNLRMQVQNSNSVPSTDDNLLIVNVYLNDRPKPQLRSFSPFFRPLFVLFVSLLLFVIIRRLFNQ